MMRATLLASLALACGGSAPAEPPSTTVGPSTASGPLEQVKGRLCRDPLPELTETCRALSDVRSPLRALELLEARERNAPAMQRRAALLVGARLVAELGARHAAWARLSALLEEPELEEALRELSLNALVEGVAGPPELWASRLVLREEDALEELIARAPESMRGDLRESLALALLRRNDLDRAATLLGGAPNEPKARYLLALVHLSMGRAEEGRSALLRLAAGSAPVADQARIALAALAIRAAHEVRRTVYDSPYFHGEAAVELLRAGIARLREIPEDSPFRASALHTEIVMSHFARDLDEALRPWLALPPLERLALGDAARWLAFASLDRGRQDAVCESVAAADGEARRIGEQLEELEATEDSCPQLDALLDPRAPDVRVAFGHAQPLRVQAWLEPEARALVVVGQLTEEGERILASMPTSFLETDAGRRFEVDQALARSSAEERCADAVRSRLVRRREELLSTARTLTQLLLDHERPCPE